MPSRVQGGLFLAIAILVGAVAGRASAGDLLAMRLAGLVIFALVGLAVLQRPVIAVYLGIAVPVLQVTSSSATPGLATTVLLLQGIVVGWRDATTAQRRVAGVMLALVAWVVGVGVIAAPPSPQQSGVAVAFVFAMSLGACAVICRPPTGLVVLALGGWGAAAAVWVFRHPGEAADRGGNLALGTNADGLGMLIALGAVAFAGYAIERNPRLRVVAVISLLIAFQALIVTGSRGALLSFASGLVVALWPLSLRDKPRRAMVAISAIILAFWFSAEWVTERFLGVGDRDILVSHGLDLRAEVARVGFEQGLAHPLTGIGVGHLEQASYQELGAVVSAHNVFVGIFAAAGLPAIVLLLVWFTLAFERAIRSTPRLGLALLMAVVSAGLSLEWWTSGILGPLFALSVSVAVLSDGRLPRTSADIVHHDVAR